jgi:CheY-like chemotaxis protein
VRIVASNNSFVYDELGSPGFQLVNAEPVIVASGDEAMAAVHEHKPDLAVLDADMPGIDGYTVCERIKADESLSGIRVILVLQGSISSAQLQRLATCGCDDVVVYRVPGETLYHRAARLLGLPAPSLAQPVMLEVSIADGNASELSAHATKLSASSADVLCNTPLSVGEKLKLRFARSGDSKAVEVTGAVIRCEVDEYSGGHLTTVAFDEPSIRIKAELADLALWDAKPLPAGLRVAFRGSFDERTDFSGVQVRDEDNVIFDVSAVTRINSWGARQWIMFLRSLPKELSYCFVNASSEFIKHCNMVADMLGRGSVLSFAAPYACKSCGSENERVLQVSSISPAVMHEPPVFRCVQCGEPERFDDVPYRFFAFLNLM